MPCSCAYVSCSRKSALGGSSRIPSISRLAANSWIPADSVALSLDNSTAGRDAAEGGGSLFRRKQRRKPRTRARAITPTETPTPMPAFAPVDSLDLDSVGVFVSLECEVEVAVADSAAVGAWFVVVGDMRSDDCHAMPTGIA